MATVKWKGEGDENATITLYGKTVKAGESVEIPDYKAWLKAKDNPTLEVEGVEKPPENVEPQLVPAPSQVSAQRPVLKGGEPMPPGLSLPADEISQPQPTPEAAPKLNPIPLKPKAGK